MKKIYFTEEERKEARRKQKRESNRRWRETHPEYRKQYYQDNKEKELEQNKQYRQDNKEKISEINKQYRQTPIGRAVNLLGGYQRNDKKYKRGECTLTAQWIVENIFTKPCAHCGKTGWEIIGCNRLDNTLPHTPDNVEPCCEECNKKFSAGRPKKNPVN